jgi:hypothetical protein
MRRLRFHLLLLAVALCAVALASVASAAPGAAKGPRISGAWTAEGTATAGPNAEIFQIETGQTATRTWTFKPSCRKGPCATLLTRQTEGGTLSVKLAYKGKGVYTGTQQISQVALTCDQPPKEVPNGWAGRIDWRVEVTKSKKVRGATVATAFTATGTWTLDNTPEYDAISGCSSPVVEYTWNYTSAK